MFKEADKSGTECPIQLTEEVAVFSIHLTEEEAVRLIITYG